MQTIPDRDATRYPAVLENLIGRRAYLTARRIPIGLGTALEVQHPEKAALIVAARVMTDGVLVMLAIRETGELVEVSLDCMRLDHIEIEYASRGRIVT